MTAPTLTATPTALQVVNDPRFDTDPEALLNNLTADYGRDVADQLWFAACDLEREQRAWERMKARRAACPHPAGQRGTVSHTATCYGYRPGTD